MSDPCYNPSDRDEPTKQEYEDAMSDPINDGGAAFPHEMNATQWGRSGMSLRDYVAAEVAGSLFAVCASDTNTKGIPYLEYVAAQCFNFADAWIEARNKKEGA
jgi:hypothetical protein